MRSPPCALLCYRPHPVWYVILNPNLSRVSRVEVLVFRQVQPAHHVTFCEEEHGGALVSFMTCHATTNANVEVRVAGQTVGDKHLVFAPKFAIETDEVPWSVSLPMFKDAVADAAAAHIIVVVTTTGCNGSQSMQLTIDVKQHGVFKCQ
jgi:hypothetical protein